MGSVLGTMISIQEKYVTKYDFLPYLVEPVYFGCKHFLGAFIQYQNHTHETLTSKSLGYNLSLTQIHSFWAISHAILCVAPGNLVYCVSHRRAVLIILLFVVIGVSSPKYDTKMAVFCVSPTVFLV